MTHPGEDVSPSTGATATTPRLRVAIVCREARDRGSVANVAIRQAVELAATCDVALVSDSLPLDLPSSVRPMPAAGRRFALLGRLAHVPNEVAFCLAATRALRRLIAARGLDVILFHSHATAAIAVPRLRRPGGPRFAMTTHGDVFERPPGTYDPRLTAFYRAVTPRAYRAVDRVFALSPDMAAWATRGGTPAARVMVIPNGIDPAELGVAPGSTPAPPSTEPPLRLLYVGRLSPEKGVGFLLQALVRLRDVGVPFQALIVGDGPTAAEHAAFVQAHRLAESVQLLGGVPRGRLAELYARAQVVCIPSLSDPLPTVALEALAMGRPVIGSAVGGISYLVEEGVNGLLAPPASVEALAEALARVASTPELLRTLARGAHRSVFPAYSWERIGERLGAALQALADSPQSMAA
jgi:glycosyltransferase involved in cell wall biosynthesis